ncbi:phage holin family protein [Qipengyuania sphaerica]|uniref:phage holin family protein n=1 Tax=Qipengyuania sphaerica TaxID=2867243 RepID=UPI001C886203|nr:phage holin family protein [Qipengyuania sphaerica]MBX7540775.1 phage holin family protein [Qipengyuania sphaerica]
MRDEETSERAGYEGPLDLPDDYEPHEDGEEYGPSLTDDLAALFEDGKTYAEAEVAFQKSRAAYTANRLKGAIAFGLGAFGVFHLALIALTVGVVIALVPLVGPWAATAIVTLALIVAGVVLLNLLKGKIDDIRDAFSDGDDV